MTKIYDTIIIGGGAAGLSAALYASRFLMKTLVVMGDEPGGETATAWIIDNYPGVAQIDGAELIQKMISQAQAAGAELVYERVRNAAGDGQCFTINTERNAYQCKSLILAMGSRRRHLGLPNEKELTGKGVSYCSTCDAPLYKGKDILIVGGGDSSVKGAILAAGYARKVYLLTRSPSLTPDPINLERLKKIGPKVTVIFENEVTELLKNRGKFYGVRLAEPYKGLANLTVDGIFIQIGFEPSTEIPKMLNLRLDKRNYIAVDNFMRTNVNGVYACGDSTNAFGSFKQVVTAAASGAVAANSVHYDTSRHRGLACKVHALLPAVLEPRDLATRPAHARALTKKSR